MGPHTNIKTQIIQVITESYHFTGVFKYVLNMVNKFAQWWSCVLKKIRTEYHFVFFFSFASAKTLATALQTPALLSSPSSLAAINHHRHIYKLSTVDACQRSPFFMYAWQHASITPASAFCESKHFYFISTAHTTDTHCRVHLCLAFFWKYHTIHFAARPHTDLVKKEWVSAEATTSYVGRGGPCLHT